MSPTSQNSDKKEFRQILFYAIFNPSQIKRYKLSKAIFLDIGFFSFYTATAFFFLWIIWGRKIPKYLCCSELCTSKTLKRLTIALYWNLFLYKCLLLWKKVSRMAQLTKVRMINLYWGILSILLTSTYHMPYLLKY